MPDPSARRRQLVQAAIDVIAGQGMRALTHRAVDAQAGLPSGTSSYHFSTRADLLRAVLEQIAAVSRQRLEAGPQVPAAPESPGRTERGRLEVADQITAACRTFLTGQLTVYRRLTLARYALEAEVAALPELTEILHAGDQFRALAADACRALGVEDADAAGAHLLAFLDGIVHDHLVGAASLRREEPARVAAEGSAAIRAYLRGLLSAERSAAPSGAGASLDR